MKLRALIVAVITLSHVAFAQTSEVPREEDADPIDALDGASANATDEDTEFIALPTDANPIAGAEARPSDGGSNLITISLDDVAMVDVVRMFSRISQANIIATPSNLTARVTANLDGVEWKPALSSILAMHNQALIEKPTGSGVYSIVDKQPDAPEPLIVKTLFLEYTTVNEVSPVVSKMLPANGSVSTFASRNALVVRSTENNLAEIEQIVKIIDIQSKQVCIEAQFLELNDSAIKQLGIRWDSLEEFGVGMKAGPFQSKEETTRERSRTDGLVQGNRRSNVDTVDDLYDLYGDKYQVESVTILERPDGSFVETKNVDPTRKVTDVINVSRDATSDIADTFAKTITESRAAILDVDSLNLVLSALKKTDGVSIVSNPKVIVANGATNAYFRVGRRDPIIKQTIKRGTVDSPGDEVTANLDTSTTTDYIKDGYLQTGIELKVIPTVKTDDLIEAQIEPSLRRSIGTKEVAGNSWPIISVKEIKTQFTLESGQTVAIGGLTDTTDEKQTSKIPLLGDIPLIEKYLFSHTRDVKSQSETIIFVTLTLANPHGMSASEGIPERAELVHKQLIRAKARKQSFESEVDQIRRSTDAKSERDQKRTSYRDIE